MKFIIKKKGDIISDFCNDNKALILQQSNCTATRMNKCSFSYSLYKKLDYSDPYNKRTSTTYYDNLAKIECRPIPGSIKLMYKDENHPIVCCLFAQYKMGPSNSKYYLYKKYTDDIYNNFQDDQTSRLKYFKQCLSNILDLFDNSNNSNSNKICIGQINKIIIPRKIGCYSAGGNWNLYKKELKKFAKKMYNTNNNIKVFIIKYKNQIKKKRI